MKSPTIVGRAVDFTGLKLTSGSGLNRKVTALAGSFTLDANESGTTTNYSIIYRQGGTAVSNPGFFVGEPNGLGDKTLAWLQKPWVNVTAVTRDPANAQGLQASQTVALYGTGGAATAAAIFNRRGIVWSRLAPGGDALLTAAVTFDWKRERYDAVECDQSGQVYVIKGTESDFNASDLMPAFTPGRIPLGRFFVYNDTVTWIPMTDWTGNLPNNPLIRSTLAAIIAHNQPSLAPFFAKCALGGVVKVAYYSDSTGIAPPAVSPFESSPLVTAPNGAGRDEPSFWNYAMKLAEFAGVPHLHSFDGRSIVKRTPGWFFVEACKLLYPGTTFEYLNCGIGGTNLDDIDYDAQIGPSTKTAPNARWPTRLNAMLALAPDLIFNAFGMNEIPFATGDISVKLNDLITKERAALPNVVIINVDCNPINVDNTNPLANRARYNIVSQRVSRARGCGYVNLNMPAYGIARGWYGMDSNNYAAQNNWNHPQDFEFQRTGRMTCVQLGVSAPTNI